jgi:hypothetical protein
MFASGTGTYRIGLSLRPSDARAIATKIPPNASAAGFGDLYRGQRDEL